MTGTRRQPTEGTERKAFTHWALAYPVTAMRTLAEAGYDRAARAAFLREVVGLDEADVPDFAADCYIAGAGAPASDRVARFPHSGLVRGAADECLRTVFADAYGQLVMGQDSLLIDDLIDLANDEGLTNLYDTARLLARRLTGSTLAAYVATLEARRAREGGHDG